MNDKIIIQGARENNTWKEQKTTGKQGGFLTGKRNYV